MLALLSLVVLAIVMGFLLFIPMVIHYWQAWVLYDLLGASLLTTLYLMKRTRRYSNGACAVGNCRKRRKQKLIMLCTSIGFIALRLVPALDYAPVVCNALSCVIVRDVLVVTGFYLFSALQREPLTRRPSKSSRIEGHSTGPYAIVHIPDVRSALLYLVGAPCLGFV
jgi:hypothetical protein